MIFFLFRFGHNLVICYEYVSKRIPDKALEIIGDMENLLKSIGNNDSFLKSIKIALDHVTYSMKGYILKLCSIETQVCQNKTHLYKSKLGDNILIIEYFSILF